MLFSFFPRKVSSKTGSLQMLRIWKPTKFSSFRLLCLKMWIMESPRPNDFLYWPKQSLGFEGLRICRSWGTGCIYVMNGWRKAGIIHTMTLLQVDPQAKVTIICMICWLTSKHTYIKLHCSLLCTESLLQSHSARVTRLSCRKGVIIYLNHPPSRRSNRSKLSLQK